MKKIDKTPYYSYKMGSLPRGCQLCVKGEKTVMFVTGLCPRKCFYCPISDQKSKKDVTFVNEWPTNKVKDVIAEIKICNSKGAGFTGGDPLSNLKRTLGYIKELKNEFGKKFHIHLYTSLNLLTNQTLKKLHSAGLDEIRIHPDLDNSKLWQKIDLLKQFDWDYGVEIPAIPKNYEQTKELLTFLNKKIQFLNINELEISDAKASKVTELGYQTKNNQSYGVKGSGELAKKLLKFIQKKNLSYKAHYCTAKLKDKVQLSKRIAKRAKNIKQDFDILTKDGTLLRGVIYLHNLAPGFDYEKRISKIKNNKSQLRETIKKLNKLKLLLIKNYSIARDLIDIDKHKLRILTAAPIVEELYNKIKNINDIESKPAIVEEYPTWDALIVELDFL